MHDHHTAWAGGQVTRLYSSAVSMPISEQEIASLVEPARVHKRVYTDPAIFDLEMERIWGNAWIFIGHESQVKNPGDFFTTTIGKQPVIVTRHNDGQVHIMYNRCAHKGAQLVGDTCGHAQKLRCAYHGYVFDTAGKLMHIPREEGYQDSAFSRDNPLTNIRKVARVEIYRGFIFANQAQQGPDLKSWLGPAITSFDNAVDRSPTGEIEITGGVLRYLHDANWKILLENVSDNLHPAVTHQSAWQPAKQLARQFPEDEKPLPLAMLEPFGSSYEFFDAIAMTACGNGHTYSGGNATIHIGYPRESKYVQDLITAYGEEKTNRILGMQRQNTIIYPSIAFKSALQTIRVYRPIAVDKTIQETWTFKLGGVSDDMLHTSVLYNQLIFSPFSIAGHDDYEAYHRIQHGLQTEALDWVSQHRHYGRDQHNDDGTSRAPGTSDIVFRHEFQAWKNYMISSADDAD